MKIPDSIYDFVRNISLEELKKYNIKKEIYFDIVLYASYENKIDIIEYMIENYDVDITQKDHRIIKHLAYEKVIHPIILKWYHKNKVPIPDDILVHENINKIKTTNIEKMF